jgi:prepilin-type N-terminal cleavage/methylation domain-containing protein
VLSNHVLRSVSRRVSPARGVTLLEVIIAIGVIGVLLGLALPAFSAVRAQARLAGSQSNVKQLSTFVVLYASDDRDLAPIAQGGEMYPHVISPGVMSGMPHWDAYRQWPGVLLAAGIVNRREDGAVFRSPGGRVHMAHHNGDYVLSLSFAGRSEVWSGEAHTDADGLAVGQRLSGVRSPSQKALLWDARAGHLGRMIEDVPVNAAGDLDVAVPVGRSDGSNAVVRPSAAEAPVVNPFDFTPIGRMRLHNTPDGIAGVDFTR